MSKSRSKVDIIFERIPPLVTWLIILCPIWGGLFFPDQTAYLILILNVYFLYKSISMAILLLIGIIRIRSTEAIDWLIRLSELDQIEKSIALLIEKRDVLEKAIPVKEDPHFKNEYLNRLLRKRTPSFLQNWLNKYEKNKILKFIDQEISRLYDIRKLGVRYDWKEIRHIIIIPHWKEPYHILKETIERVKGMNYPTKNICVILGAEARDPDGYKISMQLKKEYEQYFNQIWVNNHELKDNEIIGKSSNMYSASKFGDEQIKVTVTSCDADSQLPHDYFANITYHFVTDPESEYKYYTGAVLLYANIWRLPFFARVKNSTSTLYNITKLVRTDKLIPFSTYTLSYWMVEQINFWSPDITPEDFHTFFKGLFLFPDKVSTVPIYQRVLADSAEGDNVIDTARNNYMQERRWAWGISDDGWVLRNIIKNIFSKKFSLRLIYIASHSLWDHLSVGISILITFGSNIIVLINPRFGYTVLGANLPSISSFLIQITLVFFIFTILLDRYVKPEVKGQRRVIKTILSLFEWFLQPIIGVIMVILPGIEAHTRLLFGRYLEYYLTKKK